jgi:DNA polymerase
MIIGQSPGAVEVTGIPEKHISPQPFIGPSGDLLTYMLDEIELTREEVYLANALKCRPVGNRRALPGELQNCWRKWLYEEIKAVEPLLILVLGKDAHSSVMPASRQFGHLMEHKSKRFTYLDSYHPAWFLRNGRDADFVKNTGKRVQDLLEELRNEQ